MRKVNYRKIGLLSVFMMLALLCPHQIWADSKNVMCVKTNTGQYFPVVRVSMMVIPDGKDVFEIVLKDGVGEKDVSSISFEKHDVDIDFSDYNSSTSGGEVDLTKKVYLITNTGKFYTFTSIPTLETQSGTDKFTLTQGETTEKDISYVYFLRSNEDPTVGIKSPVVAEERLTLLTPISHQLQISGCGDAPNASLYASNGAKVSEVKVVNGVATVYVENLSSGIYIVKVGKKALKFIKK